MNTRTTTVWHPNEKNKHKIMHTRSGSYFQIAWTFADRASISEYSTQATDEKISAPLMKLERRQLKTLGGCANNQQSQVQSNQFKLPIDGVSISSNQAIFGIPGHTKLMQI